jgi:hypothetical protein
MDDSALQRAVTQRNQAIACAILSITLSLALIMNTFLGHRKALVAAHNQILVLQSDLASVQNALKANQDALVQTQTSLRASQEALARAEAASKR